MSEYMQRKQPNAYTQPKAKPNQYSAEQTREAQLRELEYNLRPRAQNQTVQKKEDEETKTETGETTSNKFASTNNQNDIIQGYIPVGTTLDTQTNDIEVFANVEGKIIVRFYTVGGEEKEREVTQTIDEKRNWILQNYNWNAIIKIIKYASDESTDFEYNIPTDLEGTSADDVKIIPDAGIIAIVEKQVNNNINGNDITNENLDNLMNGVDGKPGNSFASIMGENDKDSLRNEKDNESLMDEEGSEIEIPNFENASEETIYDFFEDITHARNGLWSTKTNITNVVSIRRAIDDNVTQYNDSIAVCWTTETEEDVVTKHAKVYTASTEPGELDDHRILLPQTLTMELGYHKGRQPGGRTSQALIKNSGDSDTTNFYADDTTFNFHHGGNDGVNISGMSSNSLSTDYISTEENEFLVNLMYVKAFKILTQWGEKRNIKAYDNLKDWKDAKKYEFVEFNEGKAKFKLEGSEDNIERDVDGIKSYISNKYSASDELKESFVRIMESVDDTFEKPDNLSELNSDDIKVLIKDDHVKGILEKQMDYTKDVGDIDGKPGNAFIAILDGEIESFDNLHNKAIEDFEDLESVFDNLKETLGDEVSKSKINYLKDLKPGTVTEDSKYDGDNAITNNNEDGSQVIEQNVGGWSEGCQIVFGPEKFYEFWGHVSDKAEDSGQRRWYYTIINLESQETTTNQETE
jgi:hypothetical protein